MQKNTGLDIVMQKLLGEDVNDFVLWQNKPQKTSFRINGIKGDKTEIEKTINLKKITGINGGYTTEDDIGNSIQHFLGQIYIQEAASMTAAQSLKPNQNDFVLDLCASPGSKTSQMADYMGNKGLIVANEKSFKRMKTLRFTLNRMGVLNTVVTCADGTKMGSQSKFTKVLLDAPCSNLGQARKNPNVINDWSERLSQKCAKTQTQLIDNAVKLLADDGLLLYSTCTYHPRENEGIVSHALTEHNLETVKIPLKIKHSGGLNNWGGEKFCEEVKNCVRVYPHQNDTGGFFMALLRK